MREKINLRKHLGLDDPKYDALRAVIREQSDIAGKLYDLRTERGLSQEEVAALVGASASVIFSMEEGDYDLRQSRKILQRFIDALASEPPAANDSSRCQLASSWK